MQTFLPNSNMELLDTDYLGELMRPAIPLILAYLSPKDANVLENMLRKEPLRLITNSMWRHFCIMHHHPHYHIPPHDEDRIDYRLLYAQALVTPEVWHYEFFSMIFSGQISKIYLATRKVDGKMLAVKSISLNAMAANTTGFRTTMNERDRLKSLGIHENILKLIGKFKSATDVFMAFDYCLNRDILMFMRGNPGFSENGLPLPLFFSIALGIANGLQFLHSHFIAHGDIKPENILINSSFVPVIADYWNSVQFQSNAEGIAGRIGPLAGTPEYMAPEQVSRALLCFASDVWATGCTLYFMKCSRHLFSDDSLPKLWDAIVNARPTNSIALVHDSSIELIIQQLVVMRPDDRPDIYWLKLSLLELIEVRSLWL